MLSYLPLPNNFLVGDGLNTAGYTWNRPTPVNFELYEGRIDYNFDEKERIAITLNQQSFHSFNVAFASAVSAYARPGSGPHRDHAVQCGTNQYFFPSQPAQ